MTKAHEEDVSFGGDRRRVVTSLAGRKKVLFTKNNFSISHLWFNEKGVPKRSKILKNSKTSTLIPSLPRSTPGPFFPFTLPPPCYRQGPNPDHVS